MAWAQLKEGDYLLQLTDGYLVDDDRSQGAGNSAPEIERRFADRLSRLAHKRYRAEGEAESRCPDPLDVWMIGAPGWLARAPPEPIRSVFEKESDDGYRIIITGEGLAGIATPRVAGWHDWIYAAGMTKKKRHGNLDRFRDASTLLLGLMHDYYDESQEPPTRLLRDLSVPVVHVRASGQRRDVVSSRRTQQ